MGDLKKYEDGLRTVLISQLTKSFNDKGHRLTGKLLTGAQVKVRDEITALVVEVWMEKYGAILDKGVSAANVKFTIGSGKKKSDYITGLMKYVELRMGIAKDTKLNKQIAFAIAHKHKKTGIRIREMGAGSKWMTNAVEASYSEIIKLSEEYLGKEIENIFLKELREA